MDNHPTCPNWWAQYLCIGERYTNFKIGYCGEMKTLHAWVMEFWGQKGVDYFKNNTTGEVIDYIFTHTGKKLQIMKDEQHCIKQNEKSLIQKDLSLTELWQKGELPEGFYYIKVKEVMANYPLLANCVEGLSYTYFLDYEDYVTEVLAPTPSFNEWQEKLEENAQLKELLQKARVYVAIDAEDYEDRTPSKAEKADAKKLLTEIDEVLQ